MSKGQRVVAARCAVWLLNRNPLYLLSATMMAAGARLYLGGKTGEAGDIGVIMLTLCILQAYEWLVGGLLVLLCWSKRSPEDRPSLLLVSGLFWTGPMAAVIELTAQDPKIGASLAIGVCIIALGELHLLCRAINLDIRWPAQLTAAACIVLLAVAQPLLAVPADGSAINELYLYAAWWVLAALALGGLCASDGINEHGTPIPNRRNQGQSQSLILIALAVGATAFHLIAMNHAFFGHARLFYVSPLILAISAFIGKSLARSPSQRPTLWVLLSVSSTLALVPAARGFDAGFPAEYLPTLLADPLIGISLAASLVWWAGCVWMGGSGLLHGGTSLVALAAVRCWRPGNVLELTLPQGGGQAPIYLWVGMGLIGAASYFLVCALIRRSRVDAALSVIASGMAVLSFSQNLPHGTTLVAGLVIGWSCWLIAAIILDKFPSALLALIVAVLAVWPWFFDADPILGWPSRAHAVALVLLLGGIGLWRADIQYHVLAVTVFIMQIFFHLAVAILLGDHPAASGAVAIAFVTLTSGALVSWYKHRLLPAMTETADN